MLKEIIIASGNKGKIREAQEILKEYKQSVIYEYVTGKKEVSANE